MKTLWQKKKLLIMSKFLLSSQCSQKSSATEASESVCKWERANVMIMYGIKCCDIIQWVLIASPFLTYPHILMSAAEVFWKQCGKRRLLIMSNFFFYHNISTLFNNHTFSYRVFPYFTKYVKVVCSRCVVCGKGLIIQMLSAEDLLASYLR